MRDGGSHRIKIPPHGDQPGIEIVMDGRANTRTPGEYYLARDYPWKMDKPMMEEAVLRAFEQAEAVLIAKYGKEFLYQIIMHPLVLNGNITEEEYLRRVSDLKFIERVDISDVLLQIQQYRAQHKTEPAGADQPATKPADRPIQIDQPSTPTSKAGPR